MKLQLKVVPGASRESMEWLDPACSILKVRVTAPPEKGKANKAVTRYLAKSLGLTIKDVDITSGTGSQQKIVELTGISEPELRVKLDAMLAKG